MKRITSVGPLLSSLLLLLAVSACDEPACKPPVLSGQNHARFPVGDTYWLPNPGSCGPWKVVSRPTGASADVVAGADDHSRLTPDAEGQWSLSAGETSVTINVVTERPFHHLNYYETHGLALAGGSLWVASPMRGEVVALEPSTLATQQTLHVGPWPVALAARGETELLVAQRGSDSLGVIDVKAKRLVDAIWVGDEPADVQVTGDGATAYVSLATEAAIAVVDLNRREVVARWAGPNDPMALALSTDGATLAVASHRSGYTDRFPWGEDPVAEERDLALIDTATGEVRFWLMDIGTTISAMAFSPAGDQLAVALIRNDVRANLADSEAKSFEHLVVVYDVATGKQLRQADLSRQSSSTGFAVALHGLSWGADRLWVTAEGNDQLIALKPDTLAEVARLKAEGRPRSTLVVGDKVWAHGGQALSVHAWSTAAADGAAATASASFGADPRPSAVAAGQKYFTGAGRDFAQNWACNTCHTDGLTDTLIWNAGPFASRLVTRPFFWLEGTWPLGWQGYLSSVRNYAFTVNTNVGVRPTTDEAEQLGAYLASLMPPPAANGRTHRDGSLSEQAERGKALYEGKAKCAGCHALPLTTSRARFDKSLTEGQADVPSLVGSYRQGVWMKHGEARTLKAGVKWAVDWSGVTLSDGELDDLSRYVEELTARDFFVLNSAPRAGAKGVGVDRPVTLTMSHPVWNDPANLKAITLKDADGTQVAVKVTADGRHITVTPEAPLAGSKSYTVEVPKSLKSWSDRPLFAATKITFETNAETKLKLDGEYRWTVDMPIPKPDFSGFNTDVTAPSTVVIYATQTTSGADTVIDYGDGLVYTTGITVSGAELLLPALPVPVGPSFADSFGDTATLLDDDGDGVADRAEGELTIAGPGFEVSGIRWTLSRPPALEGCPTGPVDGANIQVKIGSTGDPVITWDGGETNALGVYVTEPGANLPLGPGSKVTGGKTFWAVAAQKFPAGMPGPITYGVTPADADDVTADQGGTAGGVELPKGKCVQFGVITNKFQTLLFLRAM